MAAHLIRGYKVDVTPGLSEELRQKESEAIERIIWAIEEYGINRVCSAYSGGKDSRLVLHLARKVLPGITVIHNGHAGEKIDGTEALLCVKEPKAENVPKFVAAVDLACQFDGTRIHEDKTVIFDGQEIHRSKMPGWMTVNGVWGMGIVFPVWDWTDDQVWEYLRAVEPVRVLSSKKSIEGEGPLIGTPTLFCRVVEGHPMDEMNSEGCLLSELDLSGVQALYVNTDCPSEKLIRSCVELGLKTTIDCPRKSVQDVPWEYLTREDVMFFLTIEDSWTYQLPSPHFNGYLKITSGIDELEKKLEVANRHAAIGWNVLLMPRVVDSGYDNAQIGNRMMKLMRHVADGVQLMPPVHELLEID